MLRVSSLPKIQKCNKTNSKQNKQMKTQKEETLIKKQHSLKIHKGQCLNVCQKQTWKGYFPWQVSQTAKPLK